MLTEKVAVHIGSIAWMAIGVHAARHDSPWFCMFCFFMVGIFRWYLELGDDR